jgi:type II secretion system protein H
VTRRAGAPGFTLTELVVVLALLGIVAASSVPALRNLAPDNDVSRGAHEMLRLLQTARATALQQGVPIVLRIDPVRRRYVMETASSDSVTTVAHGAVPLSPSIALSSRGPGVRITFHRLGTAEPDSMTVSGDQGSAVIAVDHWTGEPYVRPATR